MEKKTKIILGVSVAVLVGLIIFIIYWFTKSGDDKQQQSSETEEKSANIVASCPKSETLEVNDSAPMFALKCGTGITHFQCNNQTLTVDAGEKYLITCNDEPEARCNSGKKDVGKFDCKGSVSAGQNGDTYTAKCNGKDVGLPELRSCQNFDVSCLNGKCKVCCDNVAAPKCPTGTTTFYTGKCNDQKITMCNDLGCSFTCNGKTVNIPDTSIKSLEKKCINGECVVCGKNTELQNPTCVYGRQLFSGVCEKMTGGCKDGKCSVFCDMTIAATGSNELNYSCLNKNCVVCG